jgi:hypothetical protein
MAVAAHARVAMISHCSDWYNACWCPPKMNAYPAAYPAAPVNVRKANVYATLVGALLSRATFWPLGIVACVLYAQSLAAAQRGQLELSDKKLRSESYCGWSIFVLMAVLAAAGMLGISALSLFSKR